MNEVLERLSIYPKKIHLKRRIKVVEDDKKKYVIKENRKKKNDIYQYLENRNFLFFPKVITKDDSRYEITEYINEIDVTDEQKLTDMIYLLTLLHTKTTFYKEVDLDYIKQIFENMVDYFNYLYSYYSDINTMIEQEVYMAPSHYLLIRNITNIYTILNIGNEYIHKWYESVKDKKTMRYVLNHNYLEKDHLLEDEKSTYFISWDKSSFGYNVNDIYNLYHYNYQEIELETILNLYQSKYPLNQSEFYYLIPLLASIKKIDLSLKESVKIKEVYELLNYINGILEFISKQDSKKPNKEKNYN